MATLGNPGTSKQAVAGTSSAARSQQTAAVGLHNPDEETKVDFIHRTMMEREASGKRKIKPTYLPEATFVEDSDDPDFDVDDADSGSDSEANGSSSSSNSNSDDDSDSKSSKDSDDDSNESEEDSNSDSDSSKATSDSSTDEDSESPKSSILKTMMAKLDQQAPLIPTKKRRKKPKPKASSMTAEAKGPVVSTVKSESTPTGESSQISSKKKPRPKPVNKSNTKNKKTVGGIKKKAPKKAGSSTTESKKKKEKKAKKKRDSISQMVADYENDVQEERQNLNYTVEPLCSICLSHKPTYHLNEVVQCDSCRLNCHEECYLLVEEDGISETASSSSTAPWFCDPCKVGKTEVFCELCPNLGGLFKETVNRLWVHKICAMYTPGAFPGNQKACADLSGIPNTKWGGGKVCSACDNEIMARIGVPVKCDAAMCKEHFHVTCAQRLGLLSDPYATTIANEADPLYISCRAHISSSVRKRQAEAFKIAQEQTRLKTLRIVDFEPRIMEKLKKIRAHYEDQFKKEQNITYDEDRGGPVSHPIECDLKLGLTNPDEIINSTHLKEKPTPQKKVRFLENSAFGVGIHQRKATFSHYDVEALLLHEKNEKTVQKVSKMWNVNPGITVAFAAYYADRQRRIMDLTNKCKKERKINDSFSAKEVRLNTELETKVVEQMEINDETLRLKSEEKMLRNIIEQLKFGPSKEKTSTSVRSSKSPTRSRQKSPPKSTPTSPVRTGRETSNGRLVSKGKNTSTHVDRRLELHRCVICHKSEKQHLIIQCDKCRKFYHLGCLDPPLTKKPRITSTCGWMCADCDEKDKEEEEEEPVVDVDAPRTLRGRTNIKKPVKYARDLESDMDDFIPTKQMKVSPPVKAKKEKKPNPPQAAKPRRGRPPSTAKRDRTLSTGSVVVKQEVRSPATKTDNLQAIVVMQRHIPSDRRAPVVNLSMNGTTTTAKSPIKQPKSSPNAKPIPTTENESSHTVREFLNCKNPWMFYPCAVCDAVGNETTLVKCDSCNLYFHFVCLTPPVAYTPKRKGYKWFCKNCDDADDDEDPISLS